MKILLTGANGQLGRTFIEHGGLARRGELIVASRDGISTLLGQGVAANFSYPQSLTSILDLVQPDVIINTAAYTAVDRAESEEELATRVNGDAVGVLGTWAAAHAALVIHYSTDYVFDGNQPQPYAVNAATAPLGAYGRSKLAGEVALRDSGADQLIFRTAWVYAPHSNNFLRTMLRLGAERDELRVVTDQHGAPTDTGLIVNGTLAALDRWLDTDVSHRSRLAGTHHLVASGSATWHEFATAIFAQAMVHGLLARKPRVIPIGSVDFPTPAQRPAWSLLDNRGFEQHFDFPLPTWEHSLDNVLRQLASMEH